MMAERLWQKLFDDPTQWWDCRRDKRNRNQPDFRHVATGECLWIDSRLKPAWVEAKLNSLREGKAGPCQVHSTSTPPVPVVNGVASLNDQGSVEQLWQKYFDDPSKWWDYRKYKLHPGSPDFTHKSTSEAVWIKDRVTPQWVRQALTRETSVDFMVLQRDEYSWTALISQHTKRGQSRQALKIYERMHDNGVKPSSYTFVAALKACSCLRDLERAKEIHAEVVKSGLQSVVYVGNVLVDVYSKCGSLVDARHVFDKMPHRNVVSWNAMILGYAQMQKGKEALLLYASMLQEGVVPNDRTFVSALNACSSLAAQEGGKEADVALVKNQCLKQAKSIHMQVVESGFESDIFVATMLVDVYAKCESLVDATRVFQSMAQRDVVSWTAIISGYAQVQEGEVALQLYIEMKKEKVAPNNRTFFSALKACSSLAKLEVWSEENGQRLKEGCLEKVRAIHSDVVKSGSELDVFVGSLLVDVYAKCGSLTDARYVFEKMPQRDVVSWTSMILSYAQMDKGEEAVQLFERMQQEGVGPNNRTFVAVLKACRSLAASEEGYECDSMVVKTQSLEQVKAIHLYIVKSGYETDAFVATMLVDVYAKCGSLGDARSVFEKMPHRDVASWNSMIMGYVQMEKAEEAMHLYSRMQQEGMVPDARTFVGALRACGAVAGLHKGKEIHAQISDVRHHSTDSTGLFVPACLIDMYCKCGSMENAQQVFDALPSRDVVIWSGLIAGYAHQGESELVFDLFQRMSKDGIQPDEITFLSVLTVCSQAGLVDKGQMYFEAMSRDYGMDPTMEHYNCIIDLLGRAGQVHRAMHMVKTMPFKPTSKVWRSVLGACRKWRNVDIGREAFKEAVRLDKLDAAAYVLMSNIYAAAHMWEDAKLIHALRVQTGAWKQPGKSWWTDVTGIVHTFVAGDQQHPESKAIQTKLQDLIVQMGDKGYSPHLDSVLRDIPDDEKADALCGHSEKLAISYALLKTPQGTTIRVVKNLRVCEDCHIVTKLISRIEKRTIICRDASRFHVFKDGNCSCRDFW